MKKHLEIVEQCPSCGGTGLYVGMAERDGAAVVCHTCNGTGRHVFKRDYEEFAGRRPKPGVTHVYGSNPGFVAAPGVVPGGVPVAEWALDGRAPHRPGAEMRENVCPAWWYQTADYKKKPNWDECSHLGRFADCRHFPSKSACWERWDREYAK